MRQNLLVGFDVIYEGFKNLTLVIQALITKM